MAERFELRWDGVLQAAAGDWSAWPDDVFATEAVA